MYSVTNYAIHRNKKTGNTKVIIEFKDEKGTPAELIVKNEAGKWIPASVIPKRAKDLGMTATEFKKYLRRAKNALSMYEISHPEPRRYAMMKTTVLDRAVKMVRK